MDQNNLNFDNENLENELNINENDETIDTENEQQTLNSEHLKEEKTSLDDKIKAQKRGMKVPLVLSLFGLILSLFCGSGLPLSLVGFILATVKYKKIKSQSLLWAKNLGLLGIIMNVVFTISLSIFIAMMEIANPDYAYMLLII